MEGLKRRLPALLVCIVLVVVGWFGGSAWSQESSYRLTSRAAGLSPGTVVMTVGGEKVDAQEYLYWLTTICDTLTMYGVTDWDADSGDGTTLGDYAKQQADEAAAQYAVLRKLAREENVGLTEEQQKELDALPQTYLENFGSKEMYRYQMAVAGLNENLIRTISTAGYLYPNLNEAMISEGRRLEPTDENLSAYAERHDLSDKEKAEQLEYYRDQSYGAFNEYFYNYIEEQEIVKTGSYDRIQTGQFYSALSAARMALPIPEIPDTDAEGNDPPEGEIEPPAPEDSDTDTEGSGSES